MQRVAPTTSLEIVDRRRSTGTAHMSACWDDDAADQSGHSLYILPNPEAPLTLRLSGVEIGAVLRCVGAMKADLLGSTRANQGKKQNNNATTNTLFLQDILSPIMRLCWYF